MIIPNTEPQTQTLPLPWRIEKPGFPNGTYTVVVAADGSYVTSDGTAETKARIAHYANAYGELLAACKAMAKARWAVDSPDLEVSRAACAEDVDPDDGWPGEMSLSEYRTWLWGRASALARAAITFAETGEQ